MRKKFFIIYILFINLFLYKNIVYANNLSPDEREMLAKITEAEAGGEEELGQRLVIDTVLNRVDHESFPNSVEEVIEQKGQFTSLGSLRDDILVLVCEEELERTNDEVLYFRTKKYSSYGTPLFQEGRHYFNGE